MLRRALTAVATVAVAALAAGCASLPVVGEKGGSSAEAEALLAQANAAAAELESITFQMRIKADVDGEQFTMVMRGGGYLKGERLGDMVFDATMEGAAVPQQSFGMVMLDGAMWVDMGTGWTAIPGVGLSDEQLGELNTAFGPLDIVDYVRDVRVEKNTTFLGEPVTKIVGTIDAQDFMAAMFGQLGSSFGSLGVTEPPADVLDGIGDIRFVIYVSDLTHLVRAVHETLSFEQDGHSMTVTADVAVIGVDEPIEIPDPSGASV